MVWEQAQQAVSSPLLVVVVCGVEEVSAALPAPGVVIVARVLPAETQRGKSSKERVWSPLRRVFDDVAVGG